MENMNLNEAIELINKEDFIGAQKVLKDLLVNEPDNVTALKNLGLCEVNLDNPPEAIEAFSKVIELAPDDALSLFYLANCYSRIGDKETAINQFQKVIELRPDYLDAYKSLAMIYIEFSQIDNAIEIAQRAIDNPTIENDASLYYIIATSYMLKKDYMNAIKNLEKSLEIQPEHTAVANSLGVCYMNVGLYDKSKEVLEHAYRFDEKNSLTAYNLGIYYETVRDYSNALKYFQISYQIEPTITMLSTLANCAIKAQEYQSAVVLYQNLVMAYPNNTQYRLSYIEALEATQNYQEALDNVNKLLMLDEKNVDLIKRKGALLRKLGLNQESIETFDTLIKRGKIDVEVYYNLAFNYIELNNHDDAKEMFKKCIILEPNNPYAHKDLGILYLKMNCYEWAVEEILEAINLEDDVAEFYYSLGVAYMMLSRVEDAKIALLKSLELEPDNPDTLAYLGYVYILQRDSKAFETLQQALKIAPENFIVNLHLAKYYYLEKKYTTAKEFLLNIIEKTKDDETLNMFAICCLESDEYDRAIGIFYKLSLDYPDNYALLTNLAKCEYKCGKIDEAKEHLRQALMVLNDYKDALDLLEEINSGK